MLKNIQWSVVWSVLRTLLAAGGPVGALLIALGFPPVQVSELLAIGLAAIGVLSFVVPGIFGALTHTDDSKVASIKDMPIASAIEAVDSLPVTAKNQIKIATMDPAAIVNAAAAQVGVKTIEIAYDAGPALSAVAENPGQPKVITEGTKS